MNRLSWLFMGVVLGGGLVYGSLNYHVLRTDKGVEFVPKASATFEETYLDIRNFGVSNWAEHDKVAQAVVKAGKEDLLKDAASHSLQRGVNSLIQRFNN